MGGVEEVEVLETVKGDRDGERTIETEREEWRRRR